MKKIDTLEAHRTADQLIKQQIILAGLKLSDFSAKEYYYAARELWWQDPNYVLNAMKRPPQKSHKKVTKRP